MGRDQVPGTVLHLIDTGGPGGAETVLANVVEGLPASRWRPVVVLPERDWLFEHLSLRNIESTLLTSSGSFDYRFLLALDAIVRRERVTLIHAHLLTSSVYGSLVARLRGIPVVCTFHGQVDVSSSERFRRTKVNILDRRKNRVVFVSEALREHVLSQQPLRAAKTTVIPNGIDPDRFRPQRNDALRRELGIAPEDILVGAVGNVRHSKDYDTFLRAAALLRQSSPRFRFVVVGDTRTPLLPGLMELREQLDLAESFSFLGFREDTATLLNNFDVFALSSDQEGFSIATIQAMATGLPVVATRCGGPEEILTHDVNGVLVPTRSPETLARAILNLVGNPEDRDRLAQSAREEVLARFTLERMVSRYEDVYADSLGRTVPKGASDSSVSPVLKASALTG